MAISAALPTYLIGSACIGVGLVGFASPSRAYAIFGLPLGAVALGAAAAPEKTHPAAAAVSTGSDAPSPYVYAKAVRDISLGLAFIVFEYTENRPAVTTTAGLMALTGAVDGWIVWKYGGPLHGKAWGHWNGTLVGATWFALRYIRDL